MMAKPGQYPLPFDPTIREVMESRQRYTEACKYLDEPVIQYTSYNCSEHTKRSKEYRELIPCLRPGRREVIAACRKAVLVYADEIEHHLPQLAEDLRDRYASDPTSGAYRDS